MEKTLIIFTLFLFAVTTALIASDPITVTDDSVKTQTFTVKSIDQSSRFIFSRSHPVKHQFHSTNSQIPLRFVKRHPCRKFLKTLIIRRSYGNDAIVNSKTFTFDTETIGNDQVSEKFLDFKHSYGHRHHHEHLDHENNEHKEKKRGFKSGFARVLILLHKARNMAVFHRQLAYCVSQFVQKDGELGEVVGKILIVWPVTNCEKEVLLIGEVEEIVENMDRRDYLKVVIPLWNRIVKCIKSNTSQVT